MRFQFVRTVTNLFSYQVSPLFRIPAETRHKPHISILRAWTIPLSCCTIKRLYGANMAIVDHVAIYSSYRKSKGGNPQLLMKALLPDTAIKLPRWAFTLNGESSLSTSREFATENEDYWGFDSNVEGNITQDFKLTAHFAKKLSYRCGGHS